MKKQLLTIIILITVLTLDAQSPWTQKTEMTWGKIAHEMVLLDDNIYVFGGGLSSGIAHSTMEAYDPVADTWTIKAAMDSARSNFASCVFDGKILAFGGGHSFYRDPLMSVEEYDPISDSWSYKTMMPRHRMGQWSTERYMPLQVCVV
jgi:N-acetylneuraminic acid mutarotase